MVVDNHTWSVESVTHFPKDSGRNGNENSSGWDEERDADMTVHLVEKE